MDIMTHFDPEKRPYYVIATQKKMPKRSPDEKSKNAERFVSDYVSNYNDTPTLAQLQECPAFSVVYRFTNGQATPDELLQAALYIDARFNTTTHSFDVMWKIGLSYDGIYRFHKIGRCIMDTRHTEKLNDNDQRVMCDFWQHNFISHTAKEYRLYRARCKNFERKLRAKSGIYLNRFSKDDRILTPMEILQCGIVTRHCFNRSLRKVDEFLSTLVNDEGNYTPLGLQIPPEYQIFIPYHRALVLFEANKSDINTYNRFALNKYNRVEKITSKIIDDNGTFSSEALILTPRQMSLMAYVRGISLFCRRKFAAAAAVFAQFIDDNGENGPLAFALPKHSNGNTGFEPNFNDTINKRGIALVNLRKDAAAVNVLGRLIDAYNQEIAVGEREPEITKWSATVTFMLGVALGNLHRCLDAAHVLFQLIKASGDESALAKCLPLYTRSKARFLLGESLHHLTTTSDGEVICLDNDATMTIPLNNALIAVLSRFLSLDYIDDTEDMSHLKSKRQRVLVRQYLGRAMSKNLDFVGSAAVLSKLINDDGNWDALMAGTHDNAIRSDVIFARVNSLILSDVNTAARVSMAFFNEYGNLKGAISDSLDVVGRIGLRHACVRNLSIARKEIGNEQKTKILNIASKFFKDADVHLEPCPEQFRENTAFVADLTFWYASLRNHFFGYDDQLLQRLLLKFRSDPYSWNTYMFNALWSLDQQDLKNMGTTPMI
ncbi:hypothetical protein FACS1894122_02150 [Alphaproteobacteria bacterium]|nr:hypothetical protein FACS1894122_02150 [Alphaproteobacteria bacterium]